MSNTNGGPNASAEQPPPKQKNITVIVTDANIKSEYTFLVNDTMTVGQLKQQVAAKIGKSEDRIKLSHRDKTMMDNSNLWDHIGLNNIPVYAAVGTGGEYALKI